MTPPDPGVPFDDDGPTTAPPAHVEQSAPPPPDVPFEAAIRPPTPLDVTTSPSSLSDPGAEARVLSACLIDQTQTIDLALSAGLVPSEFHGHDYAEVFRVMQDLRRLDQPVDEIAVLQGLNGHLHAANPALLIAQVGSAAPTTARASQDIGIIRDLAARRGFLSDLPRFAESARDLNTPIADTIALHQARLAFTGRPSKSENRLTVWTPAELRAYTPPPNFDILGRGFLRRQDLTTMIGPPGVGKSRLTTWLAICQITGRDFLGIPTYNGPARWLMIGNEDSRSRQKSDLEWFYRNLTTKEQLLVDEHLHIHVLATPEDGILDLGDTEATDRLEATISAIKPDVVRLDPWANMVAGDENDTQDTRDSVRRLTMIMRRHAQDAAPLVVHHARTGTQTVSQAGSRYSGGSLGRGSKVLVGAARCELALWPGDREDHDKLVLTCEKCNNAPAFTPIGITFQNGIYVVDPHFDSQAWRDDIDGKRSAKTLTIEDITEAVRGGRTKFKDLASYLSDSTGASSATVKRRLQEAVVSGWIEKTIPAGSYTLGKKSSRRQP